MGTHRQNIVLYLEARSMTPRELAKELGVRMSDLLADLEHVRRSLKGRLEVEPARFPGCGQPLS